MTAFMACMGWSWAAACGVYGIGVGAYCADSRKACVFCMLQRSVNSKFQDIMRTHIHPNMELHIIVEIPGLYDVK